MFFVNPALPLRAIPQTCHCEARSAVAISVGLWGNARHPLSTEIASSLALLAKTVGGYAEVASRSLS